MIIRYLLAEIFIFSIVLILLVYGVLPKTREKGTYKQIKDINSLSIGVLIIAIWLIGLSSSSVHNFNNIIVPSFHNEIISISTWEKSNVSLDTIIKIDPMVQSIKGFVLMSVLLVLLISRGSFAQESIKKSQYSILVLTASLGLLMLIGTNDLVLMYLAIELQSLPFYTLASLKNDDEASTEAGLKYFVLGALSSGILLFGCSIIYGLSGLTNIAGLNYLLLGLGPTLDNLSVSTGLVIGILFIAVALLFKLGAAPFHVWVPDVYQGSPTIVTAFFAIVPKIAILTLFIELFLDSFIGLMVEWQLLTIISAVLSMAIGTFGALTQSFIKRLLAYSAIGHIGYMTIGVSVASLNGIQGLFTYITIYTITTLCTFGVILSHFSKLKQKGVTYIVEFTALSRNEPILAFTFSTLLLSMAGIPPLAGFLSKYLVFSSAIQSHFYLLALIGVVTSVLAAIYYLRIINLMFFAESTTFHSKVLLNALDPLVSLDLPKSLILGSTLFVISFLLFYPAPLWLATHSISLFFVL